MLEGACTFAVKEDKIDVRSRVASASRPEEFVHLRQNNVSRAVESYGVFHPEYFQESCESSLVQITRSITKACLLERKGKKVATGAKKNLNARYLGHFTLLGYLGCNARIKPGD